MNSHTTRGFREAYEKLPPRIRAKARQNYKLFKGNPLHPSLHFKQVHPSKPIFSIHISLGYRAIGVRQGEEIVWFWIGSHADYDRLISK